MIVVADTSPLVHLAAIDRLEVLHRLYGTVLVPEAVFEEATRGNTGADANRIRDAGWIQVRPIADAASVASLLETIDRGEAEALVLARDLSADFLLIDDARGRQAAGRWNIRVIGLLGVLVAAKNRGLIASVSDTMQELETKASVWWTDELKQRALQLAGETRAGDDGAQAD